MGRLHSLTNGSFREAKLQWRLFGDELETMAVVSRPKAELGRQGKQPFNAALEGAQRVEGTNTGQENGEAMTVVCMRLTNHLGGYAIVIRVNCFYVFEVV